MDYILDRIRQIRKQKGIKQGEMAEMLDMTQSNYGKLERGDSQITLLRLQQIAKALSMTIGGLVVTEKDLELFFPQSYNEEDKAEYLLQVNKTLSSQVDALKHSIELLEKILKEREEVMSLEKDKSQLQAEHAKELLDYERRFLLNIYDSISDYCDEIKDYSTLKQVFIEKGMGMTDEQIKPIHQLLVIFLQPFEEKLKSIERWALKRNEVQTGK